MMNVFAFTAESSDASSTCENPYPVRKSTWSELDQLVRLLLPDLRLGGVVLVDDFYRAARHLTAELFDAQIEAIPHVVADGCRRTAEGPDEADFDAVLRRGRDRSRYDDGRKAGQQPLHPFLPDKNRDGLLIELRRRGRELWVVSKLM